MTDRPPLADIEAQVVTFTAEQFGISLDRISLDSQPVDDLGIDSLDMIEWFMALEEHFQVSLPEPEVSGDQVYKEVFTRNGFTLRDMAELVHLRWGHPPKRPSEGTGAIHTPARRSSFSQLGGVLESMPGQLYRAIGRTEGGLEQYRRMTDGMTCVHLPGGEVEIGSEDPDAGADERPLHLADLAPFLMDTEVVSATAYCRFLNSIGPVADDSLKAWFWIAEGERRHQHQLIRRNGTWWEPRAGTAEWPMVLVSWHGANAYSLWANGKDWQGWRAAPGPHLPTEA